MKLFEIRDRLTMIPVLAVQLKLNEPNYLLSHCGYQKGLTYTLVTKLQGGEIANIDYNKWGDRTISTAHKYIDEFWDDLKSGDVIDVEFILGESLHKKVSQSHDFIN